MATIDWVQVFGVLTGASCVWLAVRQNVWNFLVGLANNVVFLILFWRNALYANALLQVLFAVLGLMGWWWWLRGNHGDGPLRIHKPARLALPALLVLTALGAAVLVEVLRWTGDSASPVLDGVTTATSVAAQFALGRKWIANWYFWIFTDVLTIVMHLSTGLWMTALLYVLFLALCLVGVRDWRRELRRREEGAADPDDPDAPAPVSRLVEEHES
jgi:nicotinamide mononucleotide transporter PnuC